MIKKKYFIGLFLVLFMIFVLPFTVQAKEPVKVYFFKGETCGFCAKAKTFFDSLKEDKEYKDLFEVHEYEIWNDKNNKKLADKAAKIMGDTLNGVPYIIIGNESWNGYDTSYDEDFKATIKKVYADDSFDDPLKDLETEESDSGWVTSLIILVVACAVVFGTIYLARKDSSDDEEDVHEDLVKNKESKEVKEEKTREVKKPNQGASKKTNNSKNNTKKNNNSYKKKK